ncbi:MAG: CofH family radical SAM protein [Deltaproteobacteria bacterium]|nr:CofH family radical SAM protein [Deltaproteobacteria bacterium]
MLNKNVDLQYLKDKVKTGERLLRDEAISLWRLAGFAELGALANSVREQQHPEGIVTYLIDRNINYTNVCNTDCQFCAFYRPNSAHPESYVLTKEELATKIEETLELGGTRILLQGGHNDDLPFDYYLDLISWIHETYGIDLNAFSPSEIHQMKLISGLSYEEILKQLQAAGMHGLPGGGAELLDEDIRKAISPKKIPAELWIEIMETAQNLGLVTTSSMVIGVNETIEQRMNHFDQLRNLQDRSTAKGLEGFNLFVSWPMQINENTSLGRSKRSSTMGASTVDYIKNLAFARIYLDNIKNHQSSWPSCGPDVAEIGLHFGCNDFGSTMIEENVVSQAGGHTAAQSLLPPEEMVLRIQKSGFKAAQRNSDFEIVRRH